MLSRVTRSRAELQCVDVALALPLLADGELSDEREMNALRGHVAVCGACRQSWDRLVAQQRALAVLAAHDDHDVDAARAVDAVRAVVDKDVRAEGVRAAVVGLVVVAVVAVVAGSC
jgi:hypothetical protein